MKIGLVKTCDILPISKTADLQISYNYDCQVKQILFLTIFKSFQSADKLFGTIILLPYEFLRLSLKPTNLKLLYSTVSL